MIQSLGIRRSPQRTMGKPDEQPANTVAADYEGAVGLEDVPTEEVAVEPVSRIVYQTDPGGLGADRFRYLRLRLREHGKTAKLKTLLITSPLPQDGKSTVAVNLAMALTERGQNAVLLLEGDLYHPTVAQRMGLTAGPGLAECLVSELDPMSVLRRVEPLHFYLLPAGESLASPSDLVHGERFAKVIQALSPHFKWIVIDSPPVGPLADTVALARYADASLLVVRAGQTPTDAVEAAIETLGAKHVLAVVLNGVEGLARRYSKYNKYYNYPGAAEQQNR